MSVLTPINTYLIATPVGLSVAPGESETVGPALTDDLPYTSVPFAVAGTMTVRYSRGEDSSPDYSYPTLNLPKLPIRPILVRWATSFGGMNNPG